jgi:polyprenyl P-hydroxybenzoate/phenylacrylic acid decarboxylase-like protein
MTGDSTGGECRKRLIVAITGASGSIYGVRLLGALADRGDVDVHLIVTRAGRLTLAQELPDLRPGDLNAMAKTVHDTRDIGADIASGSFRTDGMVVAPCSIHTLAAVANCLSDNLVARAADVCLKERRRLVLMVRETPLHLGHLRVMTAATEMGAIVMPPVPAFYNRPSSIDEIVDHTVARVLDLLDLPSASAARWTGLRSSGL